MEPFTELIHSQQFKDLINGRQFLLDNYLESKQIKQKKGPGRTPFHIPDEEKIYDLYIPLHDMWKEYIFELLGGNFSEKIICTRLLKADMHGACISIWKASCESYENQKGIVLQETMKSFRVITKENKVKSKALFSVSQTRRDFFTGTWR